MSNSPSVPSYDEGIDFAALATQDADFAKIFDTNKGRIDFQDPQAVQQLTKSLLKRDFGLTLDLPDDRLCPPVPIRYNYLRWIQDLIDTTSESYTDSYEPSREVIGIDIGVGASCIYPLLGCSTRPQWLFGGTEIDSKSFQYARKNVVQNDLTSRVRLLKTTSESPLIPLDALRVQHADFTICNPPFFTSKEEMLATFTTKSTPPSAVCTGADVEMVTDGGDAGFVLRMVEESKALRGRTQWYTSMLGKLQSVNIIVARLKELEIDNWAVACLRAGHKTRRWAVGWSYGDLRPRNDVARSGINIKEVLPFPSSFSIPLNKRDGVLVGRDINSMMNSLDIEWTWNETGSTGVGLARENVWSRSARRKKKRQQGIQSGGVMEKDDNEEYKKVALGVKITVEAHLVSVRWLQGKDSVLWESFCGMLKRAVDTSS